MKSSILKKKNSTVDRVKALERNLKSSPWERTGECGVRLRAAKKKDNRGKLICHAGVYRMLVEAETNVLAVL